MKKLIIGLTALFLLAMALLAMAAWFSKMPEYIGCLNNNQIDNGKCFVNMIMLAPPIQEAQDIAESCDEADAECFLKLGEKAITEQIPSSAG